MTDLQAVAKLSSKSLVDVDPIPALVDKADDAVFNNKAEYSSVTQQTAEGPTEQETELRAALRKMDFRILPISLLLYFFSLLDRSAIGNSKVAGMNADLKLSDSQYKIALSIFFVTYGLLEVPANLLLRRYGAPTVLSLTLLPWGLAMLLTAFVKSFAGLCVCRVALGVAEAGIVPGITTMLSFLYPHSRLQIRVGIFFAGNTVGAAFGGLIAYAISHINNPHFASWRYIFVIEGCLTLLMAIPARLLLLSSVDDAKYLTVAEKALIQERLLREDSVGDEQGVKRKHIWAAFKDCKHYLLCIGFLLASIPIFSIALSLPTLLNKGLQYDAIESQLLTIPVYGIGAASIIIVAILADRYSIRATLFCLTQFLGLLGWLLDWVIETPRTRYFATCISIVGIAGIPCALALASQNLAGQTKRSTGIAIQLSGIAIAGVVSSNLFSGGEAPRFATAHKVNIASNALSIACVAAYAALLRHENARKLRSIETGEAVKLGPAALRDLGDKSPFFTYRF